MQSSQAPKNFFVQIGMFATLYVSAISFLVFLFSVIDNVFPQVLDYYSDTSSIRFSISTLIVVFPLFIWLGQVYRKFVIENPEYKDGKLRKWIIYFTLFVTGATIAGDAIVLINSFLAGEDFTTGFIFKVLAVFVVAGSIFAFCLKDLKGYFDANPKQSKFWATVVCVVIGISIIFGFVMIGSPSAQRVRNYDNRRVQDLQSIQWQVITYYQNKNKTPANLSELQDPLTGFNIPTDPETFEPYSYTKISDVKFELCADFGLENMKEENRPKAVYSDVDENWQHRAGNHCFERTLDPDIYRRLE